MEKKLKDSERWEPILLSKYKPKLCPMCGYPLIHGFRIGSEECTNSDCKYTEDIIHGELFSGFSQF